MNGKSKSPLFFVHLIQLLRPGHLQANNNQSFGNERKDVNSSGSTKYLEKTNKPIVATGNIPCDHCGKIWFPGHTCREFYENKHWKVLSIRRMKGHNRHRSIKKTIVRI